MKRKIILSSFLILANGYLIFLLIQNLSLRQFSFYIAIDIVFLTLFFIRFTKIKNSSIWSKWSHTLEIMFFILLFNHITFFNFSVIKFTNFYFHYDILFLFSFYLFLLITEKKIWKFLPILVYFCLLSPPITIIIYDHFYFKDYLLVIFLFNLIYLVLSKNYNLILLKNYQVLKYITFFFFFLMVSGFIQLFYIYSIENIFYNWKRFLLYGLSFIPMIYSIKQKNFTNLMNLFHLLSVYFSLNVLIFVVLILINQEKILNKVNENFFAMFFDWAIFLSIFQILEPSQFYKKILHFIFFILLLVLTLKVLIIFNSKTSYIGIPLTIGFTIALFLLNSLSNRIKLDSKYLSVFFTTLVILSFVLIYLGLWKLASKGDTSLMTRFFYWYVMLQYFYNHIPTFIFGLGEYQWGFLYKYLTFDWNSYPYLQYVDKFFFLHNHAHNDLISFLIGGGILFLFVYLYLILLVFKNMIGLLQLNKIFYIFFSLFLIMTLHGITEPFAFSPYTGYIFWFLAITFLYYIKDFLKTKTSYFRAKLVIIRYKKIRLYSFIILCFLLAIAITKIQLKELVYKHYYYEILPKMSLIYNSQKIENLVDINLINNKIQILEKLRFLSLESEVYSILADYYTLRYVSHNDLYNDIQNIRDTLCLGFYFNSNIFFYSRITWLSKIINQSQDQTCPSLKDKLNHFDPYLILKPM